MLMTKESIERALTASLTLMLGLATLDLALYIWSSPCTGDANYDGSVTVEDLLILLSVFGGIC